MLAKDRHIISFAIAAIFLIAAIYTVMGVAKPLTAREMTACRFSLRSSISRRCWSTNEAIFDVSVSRNEAMAVCSGRRGNETGKSAIIGRRIESTVDFAPPSNATL